jgi:hypothetical protein
VKAAGGNIGFEFQPRAAKAVAANEADTAPASTRARRRAS